ncbi:sporulation inhibitor of replication protein SirA [Cytobacillus gottheilii]|uniref:sporulation inhibitor of replication protein SirA n=1 Tax=Cytobacillus gottheilii TaxID=859144 RepID=UPI0009BA05FE|nr:sporulation inhibitor of replication protein SirA [Cytobacillus gottheilii]
MRDYQIYLIEDEFATHYFGRERMFYELFEEYETSEGLLNKIIAKQIQFITKPIPGLRLHQNIHSEMQQKLNFKMDKSGDYIINGKKSSAVLQIHDRYISIKAKGNYDSETMFFEILRKYEGSFLAIDMEHIRYGWLKPIKERKFV